MIIIFIFFKFSINNTVFMNKTCHFLHNKYSLKIINQTERDDTVFMNTFIKRFVIHNFINT